MNLTAIFVPAIVFFTIYKIIEVLTHRKERIIIADKLEQMSNLNDSNLPDRLNQFFSERKKYTSLRAGSVLLGMGLGFLVGVIIQYCCFAFSLANSSARLKGFSARSLSRLSMYSRISFISLPCMMRSTSS